MTEIDDDDWIDLTPVKATGKLLPPVSVRLSKGKLGWKAKTHITLRGAAAEKILAKIPRFRIQIGGPAANKIRIVRDPVGGRYEATDFKGVAILRLGFVSVWPDEDRDVTEAKWTGDPDAATGMMLTLPETFAAKKPAPVPVAPTAIPAVPPNRAHAIAIAAARKPAPSASYNFGDPPPGRSALDQAKKAGK